jgi:hypothetical protein
MRTMSVPISPGTADASRSESQYILSWLSQLKLVGCPWMPSSASEAVTSRAWTSMTTSALSVALQQATRRKACHWVSDKP